MYEPKPGHLIKFTHTTHNQDVYQVDYVDAERVGVTSSEAAAKGVKNGINLSRALFHEMGGSPVVLSDEEMAALEALYLLKLADNLEFIEMIMTLSAVFGEEVGMAMFPVSEMEKMEKNMNEYKAGLDFLREARQEAAYNQAVDTANGR
jgi:hypothetical protein